MAKVSRFEKKDNATEAKGYYNMKVVMASGKELPIGGILDHAGLSTKQRALLERILTKESVTVSVTYNAFDNDDADAEDDFA